LALTKDHSDETTNGGMQKIFRDRFAESDRITHV
jgi:hypothetical protein